MLILNCHLYHIFPPFLCKCEFVITMILIVIIIDFDIIIKAVLCTFICQLKCRIKKKNFFSGTPKKKVENPCFKTDHHYSRCSLYRVLFVETKTINHKKWPNLSAQRCAILFIPFPLYTLIIVVLANCR